ncbi:MAG: amidohydrolase family protein [Pseudomonadota bacterium]|nr:amidohydrolase family protein [Pseudomonadota bacterium]
MLQFKASFLTVLIIILTQLVGLPVNAKELYFIDAHSQVDHKVVPISKVKILMQKAGVRHTFLSARGKLKAKTLLNFAEDNPGLIIPAVRSKGDPYHTSSLKYYEILKKQVASPQYNAMAEVLLYHAQKGKKAPEVSVYPDDKRVQTALNYAIKKGWPFVVHIEFASLKGKKRKKFMRAFKQLLDQHPNHPFVLTHMGQLTKDRALRLINNHKNVYFHTGWSNPAAVESSNQPWTNVFQGDQLAPEWKTLFIQYPDRFIFALDNVFADHWGDFYQQQMNYWKKGLAELPEEVSHLIAHGNAERLWKVR